MGRTTLQLSPPPMYIAVGYCYKLCHLLILLVCLVFACIVVCPPDPSFDKKRYLAYINSGNLCGCCLMISSKMLPILRFISNSDKAVQCHVFHRSISYYGRPVYQMRTLYFCPVSSSYSFSFFLGFLSSPNLSRRRLDVYHTSTHGVALERI